MGYGHARKTYIEFPFLEVSLMLIDLTLHEVPVILRRLQMYVSSDLHGMPEVTLSLNDLHDLKFFIWIN